MKNSSNLNIDFKKLIDTAPDALTCFDKDLKIVYSNYNFDKMFGLPEGFSIGKKLNDLKLATRIIRIWEDSLEFAFSTGKNTSFELNYNGKKEKRTYYSRIVPQLKDNQEVDIVLVVSIDRTEYKNTLFELLMAKEKAEESDKLKSAFLTNMSHEIRTPMNAILGFTNLLSDDSLSGEQKSEFNRIIQRSGNDLLRIIDDIIDLAKIESNQLTLNKSKFSLKQLMTDLFTIHQKNLHELRKSDKIRLLLDVPENESNLISSDHTRIKQILTNLIGNAIKFTENGEVKFGFSSQSDKLLFYVSDTGIGIEPENIGHIFERFRQLDDSTTKKYGGTGLGLTISKKLVELMGGGIWVESTRAVGSSFFFEIPLEQIESIDITSKKEVGGNVMETYNWEDKTILVTEDESTNYYLLQEILSSTKVKIIRAKDGDEAVEMVKNNNHIDLILMDIKLSRMHGIEATREVRKLNRDIPIIAQTAYAMEDDKVKCFNAGCNDYITKPINQTLLLKKIKYFFNN